MKLTAALACVAGLALVMAWWPMSRTTAMAFEFGVGFVCGMLAMSAAYSISRKRSE